MWHPVFDCNINNGSSTELIKLNLDSTHVGWLTISNFRENCANSPTPCPALRKVMTSVRHQETLITIRSRGKPSWAGNRGCLVQLTLTSTPSLWELVAKFCQSVIHHREPGSAGCIRATHFPHVNTAFWMTLTSPETYCWVTSDVCTVDINKAISTCHSQEHVAFWIYSILYI